MKKSLPFMLLLNSIIFVLYTIMYPLICIKFYVNFFFFHIYSYISLVMYFYYFFFQLKAAHKKEPKTAHFISTESRKELKWLEGNTLAKYKFSFLFSVKKLLFALFFRAISLQVYFFNGEKFILHIWY